MTKAIAALAVIGLAISAYLTWVHYAGIEPVCSGISDCERVQNSSYAELVGVPVAVLGVVTNGPPSRGAAEENATSGISLGKPSTGNSFRRGK